jgi:hypothetical protein
MTTEIFTINAHYNDFKKVLEDIVFDFFRSSLHRPIPYTLENGQTAFQYTYFGSLIICKVSVIDRRTLDIEIYDSGNCNEESGTHIKWISDEIRKTFRSGDFPFGFKNLIQDEEQCKVMENLWNESYKTQGAGAYLSTIILLGSILEGILYYQITRSDENKAIAGRARYPSDDKSEKRGKKQEFHDWSLQDMIIVSHKCGWINKYYCDHSNFLREHRNYVHPFLQLENTFSMPDEPACELSRVVLKGIFDNLIDNSH